MVFHRFNNDLKLKGALRSFHRLEERQSWKEMIELQLIQIYSGGIARFSLAHRNVSDRRFFKRKKLVNWLKHLERSLPIILFQIVLGQVIRRVRKRSWNRWTQYRRCSHWRKSQLMLVLMQVLQFRRPHYSANITDGSQLMDRKFVGLKHQSHSNQQTQLKETRCDPPGWFQMFPPPLKSKGIVNAN